MKKVVVGMSGGVDSSVAAYLLKEQGYDVIGVTMQIWQEEDVCTVEENGGCCGLSAVEDARRVAAALGIPYYVMNFREEFQKNVIDYFADSYVNGQTPNPCIACNRYVKWEALLKRSISIGADFIATGHYARVEQLSNGRYALRRSATAAKDQTYALYNLTQDQLKRTLMPVGEYTKEEVSWFKGKRINNPNTHGTGCTLSSAIAANLAKGFDLKISVQRAKDYISRALAVMLDLGAGSGPMNHAFDLKDEWKEEA